MSELKAWKLLISNGTHAANSISITDWQHLLCLCAYKCIFLDVDVYIRFFIEWSQTFVSASFNHLYVIISNTMKQCSMKLYHFKFLVGSIRCDQLKCNSNNNKSNRTGGPVESRVKLYFDWIGTHLDKQKRHSIWNANLFRLVYETYACSLAWCLNACSFIIRCSTLCVTTNKRSIHLLLNVSLNLNYKHFSFEWKLVRFFKLCVCVSRLVSSSPFSWIIIVCI